MVFNFLRIRQKAFVAYSFNVENKTSDLYPRVKTG